jgi:hypothetical protein
LWGVGQDGIDWKEAGEESNFVDTSVFVWYAWIAILGSYDGVVGRVELEDDSVAYLSEGDIWCECKAALQDYQHETRQKKL